ncbi:MAG: ABC transporter permease [Firmicutes bacterium]|nr:ABC transporter permease [Bacillota bacterium]
MTQITSVEPPGSHRRHPRSVAMRRLIWAHTVMYLRNGRSLMWTLALPLLLLSVGRLDAGRHPLPRDVALAAMVALNTGLYTLGIFGLALQLGYERHQGFLRRMRCTPTPLGWVLVSEMLGQYLTLFMQSALVILMAVVGFQVPLSDMNLPVLAAVIAMAGTMSFGIGIMLAGLMPDFRTLTAFARFLLLALLFVQGIFVKLSRWPQALRTMARWSPADVSLRLLTLTTESPFRWGSHEWHLVMALIGYLVVFVGIGFTLFRD